MEPSTQETALPGTSTAGAHYKSTEEQYFKIVSRLYREAEGRRSPDPELPATVSNLDVVNDLIGIAHTLRANTWRLYRAALRHHLEGILTKEMVPEDKRPATQLALDTLNGHQVTPDKDLPERTSSNRRRTFTENDLTQLLGHLNNRRTSVHAWSLRAANWLLAGLGTGLRPAEWEHARMMDDTRLAVITAKRKGETPPEFLSEEMDAHIATFLSHHDPLPPWIRVIEIDPSDTILIKVHLNSIAELRAKGIPFTDIYEQCRFALRRACETLWGGTRRISLYTARGQFAANSKAIKRLEEVSRLMGHQSTRTTERSYGKRRSAHASFREAGESNPQAQQDPEVSGEQESQWSARLTERVNEALGGDLSSGQDNPNG